MQEKDIVSDYLSCLNASLAGYAGIIAQTENEELRRTIQEMRDQDEARQYAVFSIAKQKGYYIPAEQATQEEINTVKNQFAQG